MEVLEPALASEATTIDRARPLVGVSLRARPMALVPTTWSTEGARGFLLAGAVLALGYGIQVGNGSLKGDAIVWLFVSLLALGFAVALPARAKMPMALPNPLLAVLFALAVAFQVGLLLHDPLGIYLRPVDLLPSVFLLFALSAFAVGAVIGPARLQSWCTVGFLGAAALLGAWLLDAAPQPFNDVFVWHNEAITALLAGHNPYAMTMPDIYGSDFFYDPALRVGGRVLVGYQYPPLSLLLATGAREVASDYRFALLAGTVGAAGFMAYGRKGAAAVGAAALFLTTPRWLFVLEQGWTEPLLVVFLAATVALALRRSKWLFVPLGLFWATKQYAVLSAPLVLLLFPRPLDWRALGRLAGKAALVAAAVTLPFMVLDAHAFFDDLVMFQVRQPFRPDSLSLLAWWTQQGGARPPTWAGFLAAVPALALALWRLPRSPAAYATAVAFTSCVFFAFSKQAFANYYFFIVGALCVAVAATDFGPAEASDAEPTNLEGAGLPTDS